MNTQVAFLTLSLRLSFRLSLRPLAALCFDPPALQQHSKCAINYWRVLTKERRLALGQLDGDDLDHGGFKRSNNQKPFQRLASKQNHLPPTHLRFHDSITC